MKKNFLIILVLVCALNIVACSNGKDGTFAKRTNGGESEKEEVSSYEKDFEKLKELVNDKKYEEAEIFWGNSSLASDSRCSSYDSEPRKYLFYAEGMNYLNKTKYGDAYDLLSERCRGFLNTDEILNEIDSKVGVLDGVYMNMSVGFEGMYMAISHGRVALEISSDGAIPSEVYYDYILCDYTFTTGKTTFAIRNSVTDDTSTFYVFASYSRDSIIMGSLKDVGQYNTFAGGYKRVSDNVPAAK